MLEAGSLWELAERRAALTPDDPAAIDELGESWSFGRLKREAERIAAALQAVGVGEGTAVSWQLPTWLESMALVLALSRLGAVQNPIIPIYRDREVGFIVQQAGSNLLIVPPVFRGFDHESMARQIASDSEGLEVLVADRSLPRADPSALPSPEPDGQAVRWLFYTSGTTSDPKGAKHTDRTIMAAAIGMCERLALTPEDRSALCFPFTHVGGIIWLFSSLLVGFANVIDESFDPSRTIDLLRREGVTLAGSGTFFHMAYLQAQRENPDTRLFPKVRACPGGGAPKPPPLHYQVRDELGGVGIVSGYGLTEAPIITMAGVADTDEVLADTEGRATRGVGLRVVTLDGRVAQPGSGEEGEIRAKAPQLMKGYVDETLDAEAFDQDGYFRTGDLGRQDAEGNVTITGRLKDVIIRKGENISAKEIEDLLFQHDKVADVAVIGLPDPEAGERACAVVVPKDGAAVTLQDLTDFLRSRDLAVHKLPERLETVDALPRNPAGKVLKNDLRARFG